MKAKHLRIVKIKTFLKHQSNPVTITEIHEALSQRLNVEASRKTIERDLSELGEEGILIVTQGIPQKFTLKIPIEINLTLSFEDAEFLLKVVPPEHRIYQMIKKQLGIG